MMKYILFYTILLVSIIHMMSCEDQFSQVLEIDLPEHKPQLVTYCFASISDDKLIVEVTKSSGPLSTNDSEVEDPSIKILKNDVVFINDFQLEDIFVGIENRWTPDSISMDSIFKKFHVADLPNDFNTDVAYKLEVAASGFETAYASTSFPAKVSISDAVYVKDSGRDSEGNTIDEITIEFDDPIGENYYIVSASKIEGLNGDTINELYIESNDPRIDVNYQNTTIGNGVKLGVAGSYISFSDQEGFDNTKVKLKLSVGKWNSPGIAKKVKINLYSISKEFYNFIETNRLYNKSQDSPFTEPVNIFNNFENGFGMFTLTSVDSVEIDL